MKILVINGSPHGARGNTEILVDAFVQGAAGPGVEVERIYLHQQNIGHCQGCFACWTKTPGVCALHDDMAALLPRVQAADVLVYATPLYVYTVTGYMKDFMDRLLPAAQPFIEIEDGLSAHPRREQAAPKAVVLITNSGFPEPNHFSGLKETIRCCFRGAAREIAGMVCCAGGSLLGDPEARAAFTWYLDAVRQAGREVVARRRVRPATQAILDRPLMEDQQRYVEMANAYWQSQGVRRPGMPAAVKAPVVAVVDAAPLPPPSSVTTVADLVAGMATAFASEAAGDLQAVLQFSVSDETPGQYFLAIADGCCGAYAGTHPSANVTVHTPADVWLGMARGEINGRAAFMEGRYTATGNLALLMRLEQLFPWEISTVEGGR